MNTLAYLTTICDKGKCFITLQKSRIEISTKSLNSSKYMAIHQSKADLSVSLLSDQFWMEISNLVTINLNARLP